MTKKKNPARVSAKERPSLFIGWMIVIVVILVIGSIIVLAPQIDSLKEGLLQAREAHIPYIMVGILIMPLTFLSAGFAVWSLALKPVHLRHAILMQFSSGFATKLVPAGVGGFALNTRFLVKRGHSLVQALAVMMINNSLGVLGHIVIVVSALLMSSRLMEDIEFIRLPHAKWMLGAVVTIGLVMLLIPALRLKIKNFAKELRMTLRYYRGHPRKLIGGLIGAFGVTLLFALVLYFCAKSLGVDLMWLEVLAALSIGIIGATVTPTPGGIGGAEAAFTAGLVLLGVDGGKALSVALLYRLLAFWLPILPGFLCLQYALRRRIV